MAFYTWRLAASRAESGLKPTRVNPGNVYVTKVLDGRYAAVRVLRVLGKTSLLSISEYLAREHPSLDDPSLCTTLLRKRGRFNGEPAMLWFDGSPPESFEFLGCVPPTEIETLMECSSYGGKWSASIVNEAVREWRWVHDREAYETELRLPQKEPEREWERRRQVPQKPKRMMSEDGFWSIIGLLDWSHEGNDEKVLRPAIRALASSSTLAIRRFEERLAFLLYQLDTKAHASNIGADSYNPQSDRVSADVFLYARCVAVANGRDFYEAALKNPNKMPKDLEFESLLGIAEAACELKTGEPLDYSTGCNYESFSNPDGWGR
jgi:hypothetical protein